MRAGVANLGKYAAKINLPFLIVVFGRDLSLEAGEIFLGELYRCPSVIGVDGENGKLRKALFLGGILDDDQRAVLVGRIVAKGPFEAARIRTIRNLRIGRGGIQEQDAGILDDGLQGERH